MTARLSLYRKAEQELYKLNGSVKAEFYNFCHVFRNNPKQPGLRLKKLKGDSRIWSARVNDSYRALLARAGVDPDGTESWLVIAVRHRKDVYEELQVAVNRITGEIEFVDLAVVGDSALRRAGITLTPAEPDEAVPSTVPAPAPQPAAAADVPPLLAAYSAVDLRELGVADQLIELALAVTDSAELDQLVEGAPLLSKDILYGLASGMSIDEVRKEITQPVELGHEPDLGDFAAALTRTKVTTVDDAVQAIIDEGDFRAWKVFLHPTQERIVHRHYNGPARVSGGPGTGKTIVALHRVKHLAEHLPPGNNKPILLTTFTKNLTTDLRQRLASLIEPKLLARVEIAHIDQLAARVLGENTAPGRAKQRVYNHVALNEMRQLLAELDDHRWEAEFLLEEWEQVILGQSVPTRSAYFQARRAGRGRSLTRPERNHIWKLIEQFTARLDKLGVETWGQASERAARFEIERAAKIRARREYKDEIGGVDLIHRDNSSGMRYLGYRYRHIIVDEAQDLSPAHWKMLRAMADPDLSNDIFIAGDTHQRIYDHQVSLGALGINIRGRSSRLTLSYRTTKEILAEALRVVEPRNPIQKVSYDDLDDGTDNLVGYRSVLHGPAPTFTPYETWDEELAGLAATLTTWRQELSVDDKGSPRDPSGHIAVCVADRDMVSQTMYYLTTKAKITCAELTKDGPKGNGEVHVGTMHRFKGLEYQRLAIVGASDGIIPRTHVIDRYRTEDPPRYEREQRKARSLLFVATTRARDALAISWHGKPSPYLPV
ncbi:MULTISPECIES: UvrD-helicase domain-containing protein [Streptomycetaceae]|uniref:DNA 3'-5' helicase n=1 Tax=Streptantibioticus cattleyicolor (strain ATCC 35852 / DSM 46488 / JCM 4925 / NBRC 14057 / NRRL 8057) TaxID=1003195 RepID=F8K251_STREN|nr:MULTISPECIES: UvrD-helicase domain-containing protein [Streptomycetaceae]AEW93751.1 putative helicase [Streptantibioticus cattleyicolor NRRL 8057 = DSM 46488]MYS58441.1 UvrD-helicase domain-containing protein [Streptomyces sp. SID5468]CCB74099.1 putative DNA helicase [Streptantibioticus cattleyicolor NRRL 8057 = DSM 46488]